MTRSVGNRMEEGRVRSYSTEHLHKKTAIALEPRKSDAVIERKKRPPNAQRPTCEASDGSIILSMIAPFLAFWKNSCSSGPPLGTSFLVRIPLELSGGRNLGFAWPTNRRVSNATEYGGRRAEKKKRLEPGRGREILRNDGNTGSLDSAKIGRGGNPLLRRC